MLKQIYSLLQKANKYQKQFRNLMLIRKSGLFYKNWYLANNPDVAASGMDPLLHYLLYGGFEWRDPSPGFSSGWYLSVNKEVRAKKINPLVHYLKYGQYEGCTPCPDSVRDFPYVCPVCENRVEQFLPIDPQYEATRRKYGYPYALDDMETLNPTQYRCPYCGALDRDRLYTLYLKRILEESSSSQVVVLDIAPSRPLKRFLRKYSNIRYMSVDKYMKGVDIVADITDLHMIAAETIDMFICSHVLEHVPDDTKALSELYRTLKPGGTGILMVPINLKLDQIDEDPGITEVGERWRRFGQHDHIRLYSKKGFMERVAAVGFVIHQYQVAQFGQEDFTLYGIAPSSVLYVGQKR